MGNILIKLQSMHDFYKKRSLLIMNKKNIRVASGMHNLSKSNGK